MHVNEAPDQHGHRLKQQACGFELLQSSDGAPGSIPAPIESLVDEALRFTPHGSQKLHETLPLVTESATELHPQGLAAAKLTPKVLVHVPHDALPRDEIQSKVVHEP